MKVTIFGMKVKGEQFANPLTFTNTNIHKSHKYGFELQNTHNLNSVLSATLNLDVSMARKYYSQRKSYKINTLTEKSDAKTKYITEVSKMIGEWDTVPKEPIFRAKDRKKRMADIYSKI